MKNELVVNPKNKGVRWVLVWLTDPKDARNSKFVPPVHPSLKSPPKTVEIDQPCCVFEPRVMALQVGQDLVVKNSAPIPHNFKIDSIGGGPGKSRTVLPPVVSSGGAAGGGFPSDGSGRALVGSAVPSISKGGFCRALARDCSS